MIALIQRVSRASLSIAEQPIVQIGTGLVALIGIQPNDDEHRADLLLHRLLNYRVFADAAGKMNLSMQAVDGALLLVSQFTLAAQTDRGLRPSFSTCAPPAQAQRLYDYLVMQAELRCVEVKTGVFGADMQVSLVNDGPVTFRLEV